MVGEAGRNQGAEGTRNELSGRVTGPVVQAGTIHQVVMPPAPRDELPVPRQLPPAVRDFAGRDHQLAALDALLAADAEGLPTATVISALDGTAGVGKTALAVEWAHRVEHRFGDGTLYANLRGYGPSAPVDPNLVLTSFLQVFGVREDRIPPEPDAQLGLYRSVLAGRRVLILLDNASTSEQVRPLLPGAAGCLVLVTSRARLTGLVVAEAASQVTLGLFTQDEAKTLLRSILGPERVDAEPGAVADLVAVCARLPLALRIAATRVATRPGISIADVVTDIIDDRSRLDVLSSDGDERSAVKSVFDWSYTQLPEQRAHLFRRLGLHPGVEFGVPAAAVVAGIDDIAAYRQLEALADAHLVEAIGARRYRCHDLLHAYAAYRAERDCTPEDRNAATARLFAWYARTAQAADRLVFPGLATLDVTLAPVGEIELSDRRSALAWLHTERANLQEVQRAAHRRQAYDVVVSLAANARFLSLRERALWSGRWDAETLGLQAARASRNLPAEVFLLGFRGDTLAGLARLDEAETDFGRQLALARELRDEIGERVAVVGLGQVRLLQERYPEALDYYGKALSLARKTGGGRPEAVVECNLSRINLKLGRYDVALVHAERELQLRRGSGDRVGEAYALCDVAAARQAMDDHDGALESAAQSIALYRDLEGTGAYLALALETAASSHEQRGDRLAAVECLTEACSLLEGLADPRAEYVRARMLILADER